MPTEILMPALSPTMEEGTLAKWLVKEGDTVSSGDLLAEIETDKATMEFEAVDEGTLAQVFIEDGAENVAVGTVIALLAEEGEDVSDVTASASTAAAAPATPAPSATAACSAKTAWSGSTRPSASRTTPWPSRSSTTWRASTQRTARWRC